MSVRVLILTRYSTLGASSRLRTFQYIPYLERNGFTVEVSRLLGDDYVHSLYAGTRSWVTVLSGYTKRVLRLLSSRNFDVIWIEKEILPWVPSWVERTLLPRRAQWIVDYDDAIFHNYDLHSSRLIRALLGRKIDNVMKHASTVTAGNDYLAERARLAGCGDVEFLPTVIDLDRYPLAKNDWSASGELVVGWIGSPSTAHYLQQVAQVAARLSKSHRVRFVAIGARPDQVENTPFVAVPWSESTEVELLQGIDIGIMPLEDGPWERGKCGYKLIQYMACARPVVASPVGVNSDIVRHGKNGFLASTEEEWAESLTQLLDSDTLREGMGQQGRRRVEETYSLQVQAPRLATLIRKLVED